MDASKTEVAIAFGLHAGGGQLVVAARTDFGADGTTDTGILHYPEVFLASHQETCFGVEAGKENKAVVCLPVAFGGRLDPMFLPAEVGFNLCQLLGDVFVHLHLFVHIEVG